MHCFKLKYPAFVCYELELGKKKPNKLLSMFRVGMSTVGAALWASVYRGPHRAGAQLGGGHPPSLCETMWSPQKRKKKEERRKRVLRCVLCFPGPPIHVPNFYSIVSFLRNTFSWSDPLQEQEPKQTVMECFKFEPQGSGASLWPGSLTGQLVLFRSVSAGTQRCRNLPLKPLWLTQCLESVDHPVNKPSRRNCSLLPC